MKAGEQVHQEPGIAFGNGLSRRSVVFDRDLSPDRNCPGRVAMLSFASRDAFRSSFSWRGVERDDREGFARNCIAARCRP